MFYFSFCKRAANILKYSGLKEETKFLYLSENKVSELDVILSECGYRDIKADFN